jgi:hypothetical protein
VPKQVASGVLLFASLLVGPAWEYQSLNKELLAAVSAGDRTRVEALIAKGADVNAKDTNGQTPLHYAAFRENREIVELLIEKGRTSMPKILPERRRCTLLPGRGIEK